MMRKTIPRILLINVVILLSYSGFSQRFEAYAHGGIIASQIDGDSYGGYRKPGLFLGVAVAYPLRPGSNLMLEMNYIQLGARKNTNPEYNDFTKFVLRTNYIQVPVFYRYELHRFLSLDGGLSFSTLVNARQFDINGEVDITGKPIHRFDLGGIVGFKFRINDELGVLLRWSYSIIPFRAHESGASYRLNFGHYHKYINLSLQYRF